MNSLTAEEINEIYKTLADAIKSPTRLIYIAHISGGRVKGVDHLEGEEGRALSLKAALLESQVVYMKG